MSEQTARYQRSMSGMIGALVVTLVAITGFVAWRAVSRDDLAIEPDAVDYLASVRYLQDAGESVVYPPSLPSGWVATSARYRTGRDLGWNLGLLTPDEGFVGLRQEDASVEQLVGDYIDKDAEEGAPVVLKSPLATSWRSFTDSGGDYGLVAEVGQETLLVFGSAHPQEIRELAASLVTTPVR